MIRFDIEFFLQTAASAFGLDEARLTACRIGFGPAKGPSREVCAQATTKAQCDQTGIRLLRAFAIFGSVAGLAILLLIAGTGALRAGAEKAYPHIDPESGYRTGHYRAALPEKAPGSKRIDAKTLKAMIDAGDVILLDVNAHVGAGYDPLSGDWFVQEKRFDIPGSTWLPDVGAGYLTPEMTRFFRENLQKLTTGDKSKAIALYCQADCWMSWNASKRASSWGYSNLYWFPEGDAGWREAGYELVEAKPEPVPVD